jgi:hypothetical protein
MEVYGKSYPQMTRREFLEFVIANFIPKKGLHKFKIIQKANQVALDNSLDYHYDKFVDIVTNSIQGLRYVRYYDYSLITEGAKQALKSILDKIDAVYSCTFFYRHHQELMRLIDIHDGYELHFLLRRLFDSDEYYQKRIDFNRQPMIGPVGMSFSDVVINYWKTLKEPVDIDWFINKLIDNYGYHPGTLINIINLALGDYICLRILYVQKPQLAKNISEKINGLLVDDFYELNELRVHFSNHGINLSDYQYFSNFWLHDFGYKTHDVNYIIRLKYSSLKELFFEKVLKHDVYEITAKDRKMRETTLILFLETLRSSFLMFPIRYEKLISMRYFESLGVSEQSLRDYVQALTKYLTPETFFSYESLVKQKYYLKSPALKKVEDYHLEREIMIDLIRNVAGVKKTTKGDLFRISQKTTIINELLEELQAKLQFADIEHLQTYVFENYGINIKKFDLKH